MSEDFVSTTDVCILLGCIERSILDPEEVALLLGLSRHSDSGIRYAVVDAMGRLLEHKEAFCSRLAEMTEHDDNSAVRNMALDSLVEMYSVGLYDEDMIAGLKERPFTVAESAAFDALEKR